MEIDYFTEITPNVYIGSRSSLYKYHLFDIVVDMAFPGIQDVGKIENLNKKGVNVYQCNILDKNDIKHEEKMLNILKRIIPELILLYKKDNSVKILFHCNAGVSRSVSIALAFLCSLSKDKDIGHIINLIKSKRTVANPNPSFVRAVSTFLEI